MTAKITVFIFLCFTTAAAAQNFQLHYDAGKGRNYVTTTFEMFEPDKWGNTFIFVDFDYNMEKQKHPALAYTEIARCFKLGQSPFSAQLEYNGGLFAIPGEGGYSVLAINNAYLGGLDYGWHSADFTKFFNFKALFKHISGKNTTSFQLTGVWSLDFFDKKVSLNGFADFWREDNINYSKPNGESLASPSETRFVFLSEPQIWYNISPHLSAGSEVEIATNFGSIEGLVISPTVGVKWTF